MVAITGFLVSIIALPCSAFVQGRPLGASLATVSRNKSTLDPAPFRKSAIALRGGAQDFSDAATALFGNVISPAAMLTGGLVPLGFLAEPLPGKTETQKKLRNIYCILSVVSLANELTAIVYATVACNKLTETVVAPAESVFALIKRDFQLPWIGTNVHFMLGLMGFVSMVMLRAYTLFPTQLKIPGCGMALSALLLMCSLVNKGVREGDRDGMRFGNSMLSLITRYICLLSNELYARKGIVLALSLAVGGISTLLAVRALVSSEEA